ncbi:31621_t:CDS:2, partial [Gigaspora margarita]
LYMEQNEKPSVTNSFDIDSDITELVNEFFTFEDNDLKEFDNASATQTKSIGHDRNNENSPLIIASEDIPKNIHFNSWNEVEVYFNEYGARNSFAVTKYQME